MTGSVLRVRGEDLRVLLVAVVGLVRQAEAGLVDVQHVPVRVGRVAVDVDAEGAAHAVPAQPTDQPQQVGRVSDRVHRGQQVGDRREARRLDRVDVHEAAVQVADQLLGASRLRARRVPPRSAASSTIARLSASAASRSR